MVIQGYNRQIYCCRRKKKPGIISDNFYWTIEENAKLKLTGYPVGMGVFKEWVKIPDSNDYYIVLNNPSFKIG